MISRSLETSTRRGPHPLLVAAIVFLVAALAAAAMIWRLEQYRLQEERAHVSDIADDHAHSLQTHLERAISASYALAALVRQGNGSVADFDAVAHQMLPFYPGVTALELAPGGVIRQIAPPGGNEQAFGLDLFSHPARVRDARLARDTGKLTLSGPFELAQGGMGAVAWLPVYLSDRGGKSPFWGFTGVLLRFPETLAPARLTQLAEYGLAYELWRKNPDTGQRQVIASSSSGQMEVAVEVPIQVANGTWMLRVAPVNGWGNSTGLALKAALGLLFSLLLAWLAKLLTESKAHEAGLEALVAERTAEIQEGEERLRQLENNLPDSYVYQYRHEADGTPRFLHLSDGVERMHGVSRQDALADAGTLLRQIDPDQVGVWSEAEAASLRDMADFQMELRMCRADGEWRWLRIHSRPRRNPDGQVLWDGLATDITELKQTTLLLQESERKYRELVENANSIILRWSRDGKITFMNEFGQRFFGYSEEEIVGRHVVGTIVPEEESTGRDLSPLMDQICANPGDFYQNINENMRRNGERVWIAWTNRPVLDEQGQVLEVFSVGSDITDRKRADEAIRKLNEELEERVHERTAQLEAANKELEAFSYSVSHDLKAPLRGIDGYSQLLEKDYQGRLDDEGRLFIRNIRASAGQMHELIEDLLDYSRMERRSVQNIGIDLPALVQAVVAERAAEVEQAGVQLRLEVPRLVVRADRDGLAIVLRNLLENALKFSCNARPPTVEIGARPEGDRAILWVRDNGIGFDMKFHDRIFEIFQRLQRAEDYPGTGIGLALVRKAMQRMGGRAWAESAPGEGATFFLEIPL